MKDIVDIKIRYVPECALENCCFVPTKDSGGNKP